MKINSNSSTSLKSCLEELTNIIVNKNKKFKKYEEDKNKLNISNIDIEIFLFS